MNWVAPIKDQETLKNFGETLKQVDYKYYIMFELGVGTGLQLQGKDPEAYLILGHSSSNKPVSREQAYRVLRSAGHKIGLNSIGAQTMRKTYAWNYYKETGDIYHLQKLFNHASPSITYRFIGEKPNIEVFLKKMTPQENERSRYLLYLNDNGKKKLNKIIDTLTGIRDNFDSPANNDAFYGKVDCLLQELEALMENYENTK